jgi:hypothetical protein
MDAGFDVDWRDIVADEFLAVLLISQERNKLDDEKRQSDLNGQSN